MPGGTRISVPDGHSVSRFWLLVFLQSVGAVQDHIATLLNHAERLIQPVFNIRINQRAILVTYTGRTHRRQAVDGLAWIVPGNVPDTAQRHVFPPAQFFMHKKLTTDIFYIHTSPFFIVTFSSQSNR